MVLIKEIELELSQQPKAPEAIEDTLLKDSVLELTSTNFSKLDDDLEDVSIGEIRKKVLVDTGYAGKPVSRKKYYKNDLSGEELAKKEITDETGKFENIDSGESLLDSSENDENLSVRSTDELSQHDDDDEFENSDDSMSGSDEETEDSEGDLDEESADEEDFDDNIDISKFQQENLPQEENIDIFSAKTKDTDAEVAKGVSAKNQLHIWETLLEGRIKLQTSLIAANKLYQKNNFADFKSKLKPEDESVLSSTCTSLGKLMNTLLELQEVLLNNSPEYLSLRDSKTENTEVNDEVDDDDNESISSSLCSGNEENDIHKLDSNSSNDPPKRKKIKLGHYTDHLEELYQDFKPFKDKTIQLWNDKTRINSGKISNTDFSAFDQPTLKQIEQILLDKNRLIKKTQLKRSDYEILGKSQHEESLNNNDDIKESERIQKEYDPEIFDDDDFYHKMLRDFIARKCSDATDSKNHGRQWLEIQHLRSKMKRKIDTRCTKGRKLRYTVHNKLVNFMAPIPCNVWSEEAENQLFKSLFGKASEQSSSIVNN